VGRKWQNSFPGFFTKKNLWQARWQLFRGAERNVCGLTELLHVMPPELHTTVGFASIEAFIDTMVCGMLPAKS